MKDFRLGKVVSIIVLSGILCTSGFSEGDGDAQKTPASANKQA